MTHNNTIKAELFFEINDYISSCIDLSKISFESNLSVVMYVDGQALAIDEKHYTSKLS